MKDRWYWNVFYSNLYKFLCYKNRTKADPENCYDQYGDAVLSEEITETVTYAEGNTLSQKTTAIRGENRIETVITYDVEY